MAKIPVYQQQGGSQGGLNLTPARRDSGVFEGVSGAAQTMDSIGAVLGQIAEQKQKERDAADVADWEVKGITYSSEVADRLQSDPNNAKDAHLRYREEMQKFHEQYRGQASPEVQKQLARKFGLMDAGQAGQLRAWERGVQRDKAKFDTAFIAEEMSRGFANSYGDGLKQELFLNNGIAAYQTQVNAGNMTTEEAVAKISEFTQESYFQEAVVRANKDPTGVLRDLGERYADMDVRKKKQIEGLADAEIRQRKSDQEAGNVVTRQTLDATIDIMEKGGTPNVTITRAMFNAYGQFAETKFQQYQVYAQNPDLFKMVATADVKTVTQGVEKLRANVGSGSVFEQQVKMQQLGAVEQAVARRQSALNKDPMSFGLGADATLREKYAALAKGDNPGPALDGYMASRDVFMKNFGLNPYDTPLLPTGMAGVEKSALENLPPDQVASFITSRERMWGKHFERYAREAFKDLPPEYRYLNRLSPENQVAVVQHLRNPKAVHDAMKLQGITNDTLEKDAVRVTAEYRAVTNTPWDSEALSTVGGLSRIISTLAATKAAAGDKKATENAYNEVFSTKYQIVENDFMKGVLPVDVNPAEVARSLALITNSLRAHSDGWQPPGDAARGADGKVLPAVRKLWLDAMIPGEIAGISDKRLVWRGTENGESFYATINGIPVQKRPGEPLVLSREHIERLGEYLWFQKQAELNKGQNALLDRARGPGAAPNTDRKPTGAVVIPEYFLGPIQ